MEVSNIIMHPLPQMTNKGERKMKLSKLREKLENNKELRNKQARKTRWRDPRQHKNKEKHVGGTPDSMKTKKNTLAGLPTA